MMTFRQCMFLIVAAIILAGCGATSQATKLTEETQAQISKKGSSTGFLGDYSMLRKGEDDEALLVYRNPNVDWKSYDKIKLDPVTIWRGGDDPLRGRAARFHSIISDSTLSKPGSCRLWPRGE